jgi:cytidylate kinase
MNHNLVSFDDFDWEALVRCLPSISLTFKFNADLGFAEMYLNGINVENEIRTLEVSQLVSKVSAISSVRKKLVLEQQEMGKYKGIVMDGRDIGTVVFPDAEIKLFMTASADTRAQRRYKELIAKGDTVSYEEILQNVVERDHLDSTRKDSPLIKAKDAIEIDNSDLGLNEQFDKIYALVKSVSSIN